MANLVSLKVRPEMRDRVKDEQNRLRKETGTEPTQDEVVEKMWGCYKAADSTLPGVSSETKPRPSALSLIEELTAEEIAWVETLIYILRSNNDSALRAVTENLKVFRRFCDLDIQEPRSSRKTEEHGKAPDLPAGSRGAA